MTTDSTPTPPSEDRVIALALKYNNLNRAGAFRFGRDGLLMFVADLLTEQRATPAAAAEIAQPAAPEPVRTYQDQIDAEQGLRAWVEAMVPTDQHAVFWRVERKQFAQPSEGGSVTVVRAHDRVVAAAICIRDDFNRTNLIRWLATQAQPATHAEVMTDEQIDTHLDKILRASGSALRHYSMQKSIDDMRSALRAAIATQAAQQPKDLGDALAGPGSPSQAPPIPIAAGSGPSDQSNTEN